MTPLITRDAERCSSAILNESTFAPDSMAFLVPGDGEGRGLLDRSMDVDLSCDSGAMCLH